MALRQMLLVLGAIVSLAWGQRPFFAGSRPIGYPEITTSTTADDLGNRFGEGDSNITTTTQRLPIEANGDKDLIDRLSKLPIDKQPFWFINWQALEANRQKPQTYPIRPSSFAQPALPVNSAGNPDFVANQDVGNRNFGGSFTNTARPVLKPIVNGNLGSNTDGLNINFDKTNTTRPDLLAQPIATTDVKNVDFSAGSNKADKRKDGLGELGNRNGEDSAQITNPVPPVRPTQFVQAPFLGAPVNNVNPTYLTNGNPAIVYSNKNEQLVHPVNLQNQYFMNYAAYKNPATNLQAPLRGVGNLVNQNYYERFGNIYNNAGMLYPYPL